MPTTVPMSLPTPVPTPEPTPGSTFVPTPEPTPVPSPEPTKKPSETHTKAPTKKPTKKPSPEPTAWKGDSWGGDEYPTGTPTEYPTTSPVWVGDNWSGDEHPSADKPLKDHGESSVEGLNKVSGMLEYAEGASSSPVTAPGFMFFVWVAATAFSVLQ